VNTFVVIKRIDPCKQV